MSKPVIRSFAEFQQYEGTELGVSDWHTITQEQINLFADATLDHQWIHLDSERAKAESPFGNTIAHGYLTVALLPHFWAQVVSVENIKMQVNYEIESLRFGQAVPVNSRVRLRVKVLSVKNLRGIAKAQLEVSMEVEGEKKPAYTGVITFLYHFNE
ncbi:MaoC family dehydratase [Cesiribacter andamanensis]|uniref:Putative enoyl-CoA hydratase 1 n=1 Tax=Cesiribacter andamanensis AMV16 TaxID=1279009 RepID=M7P147_9BACT|nr:MaoC family dehydratase [Cesiribacter andamanensis]EMR04304.1 putative enoyl-CoA hydratase 1 [Cesiribacter andamanensis AMV16]